MTRRELERRIAALNERIEAIIDERELLIRELMAKRIARHRKPKVNYRPPPWQPRSR